MVAAGSWDWGPDSRRWRLGLGLGLDARWLGAGSGGDQDWDLRPGVGIGPAGWGSVRRGRCRAAMPGVRGFGAGRRCLGSRDSGGFPLGTLRHAPARR